MNDTTIGNDTHNRQLADSLTNRFGAKIPPLFEMLKPLARYRKLETGEYLFRQGDPGSHLYGVLTGRLYITVGVPDTPDEAVIAVLSPGQVVGELSMIDGGRRSANARAEGEVVIGAVSREDFSAYATKHPEVALRMLTMLSRRLRATTQHVESLMLWDVPMRLAQTLLNLAQQDGEPYGDGCIMIHAVSQKTLAGMIGSTREWVNAILHDWQTQGLIAYQGRRLILTNVANMEALMREMEEDD